MKPQKPIVICIGDTGARVNLNNCVSYHIGHDQPCLMLKKDYKPSSEDAQPTDADFETVNTSTLSFFFLGGTELHYRVGHEITEEEFKQIHDVLSEVDYYKQSVD